jgi:Zn-dependent protease
MDKMFSWPPSWATLYLIPALLLGFTVHELAHAVVAYLLGDTSQVERKRLSFNPLRHVSWLGMAAFLLVGIGWAKPVMVDWTRFRIKNQALGMFLVSIAGVGANFLLAGMVLIGIIATAVIVSLTNVVQPTDVLLAMMMRQPGPDAMGVAIALSTYVLNVNLLLGLFNLLPLPPLDGFQALMSLVTLVRRALKGKPVPAVAPATGPAANAVAQEGSLPSPARIHFGIALAYQKAGELDEAIARYRQAIAHDDQFGLAYYNMGLAYLAKGRQPLATSAFKAALNTRGDMGVQVEASRRLRELGQADQAPGVDPAPVPAPLEQDRTAEIIADRGAPLDPALARRLWLRLSLGGALAILLGAGVWLFVTMVMLGAIK